MLSGTSYAGEPNHTYGYLERVLVHPGGLELKAKLDTGAKSSSINAVNIKILNRKREKWVRFDVPTDERTLTFELKFIRYVHIKKRAGEKKINTKTKEAFSRPVVLMAVTIGGETRTVEVNLANRERFNYPLLLGRKALVKFNALIDPALTFTTKLKGK